MSHFDYTTSRELALRAPFHALLMAAMRTADTVNAVKLRAVFPDVWTELQTRYTSPGGTLPGEEDNR